MREFQEKKKIKRRIYSKTTVIILIIVLLLFAQGTWRIYLKEKESRQNLERVESQLSTLTERKDTLTAQIERLNTEQGKEDEIRSKFQVSKPGEQVLVIVDKDSTPTTTPKVGVWSSIWSKILGIFGKKS